MNIVKEWIRLWLGSTPPQCERIDAAWERAFDILHAAKPHARWHYVRGPITAVIATLLDMDWTPERPDCWIDTVHGGAWYIKQRMDPADLIPYLGSA